MKRFPIWLFIVLSLAGTSAQAQSDAYDPRRVGLSRSDLDSLLARLDRTAESPVYSGQLKSRARFEAAMIRRRLRDGDFQVGDRIMLEVTGEPTLTDTFAVEAGRVLNLPNVGAYALTGVLRSELESGLSKYLGQYLRDPQVRARALMRLSVLGDVGQPGFYVVPTNLVLTDVLMQAGGPGRTAALTKIYVERGSEKIWEGEPLQQAITEGRTLDQLSLLAGDRIYVPTQKAGNFATNVRTFTLLLTLPLTIYGLTKIF